jgi:hypothetical protein
MAGAPRPVGFEVSIPRRRKVLDWRSPEVSVADFDIFEAPLPVHLVRRTTPAPAPATQPTDGLDPGDVDPGTLPPVQARAMTPSPRHEPLLLPRDATTSPGRQGAPLTGRAVYGLIAFAMFGFVAVLLTGLVAAGLAGVVDAPAPEPSVQELAPRNAPGAISASPLRVVGLDGSSTSPGAPNALPAPSAGALAEPVAPREGRASSGERVDPAPPRPTPGASLASSGAAAPAALPAAPDPAPAGPLTEAPPTGAAPVENSGSPWGDLPAAPAAAPRDPQAPWDAPPN